MLSLAAMGAKFLAGAKAVGSFAKVAGPIAGLLSPFLGGGRSNAQQLAIQQSNKSMADWYTQNTRFANAQAALGIAANARVQGYSRRLGDIERNIKTQVGLTFAEQQSILGRYAAKYGSGAVGVSGGAWTVAKTAGRKNKAAELLDRISASDGRLAQLGEQRALLLTSALREYQSKAKWNNQPLPTAATMPWPEGEGFISKLTKGVQQYGALSEGLEQLQDFGGDALSSFKNALKIGGGEGGGGIIGGNYDDYSMYSIGKRGWYE